MIGTGAGIGNGATARRALLRLGAGVLGAGGYGALLASCGGAQESDSSAGQPAANAPPVKLTFGTKFGAGERADWATQVVGKFNELNGPKITAEHTVLGDSVQAPELLVMLASGTGPDVTQTSGSWFSDFAEKGVLGDVTAFAKRDKVDLSKWFAEEDVIRYKGKQHGMPFWQSPGAYFFNASLFKRSSVAPPTESWTWDDLLDAARKLTKPGETWGFQTAFAWEKSWLHFIRAAGGDYLSADFKKTVCNTAVATEAMQWMVDLVQRHKVMAPPGDTSLGPGNLWNQGKVAILIGGAGTVGSSITAKPDFEWNLFPTPKHPKTGKRVVTTTDNPMVVMGSSKAPDAAWKFDLFTAEKFSQDLVGKLRINMPVLKTSGADPQGWLAAPPAAMSLTLDYMKQATYLSFHKNWLQWYNESAAQVLPAFKAEVSIKEALDKAAQVGDTLLRGV